jgi:hypothetical protein
VRDPAARQALSNADLQAAFMNDKFKDAMNLSVRYGNDAIVKMRQDANLLSQQAADIQAKLNQGVNLASLDAAISKFRSDAAGARGQGARRRHPHLPEGRHPEVHLRRGRSRGQGA